MRHYKKFSKILNLIRSGVRFSDKVFILWWVMDQKKGVKSNIYLMNQIGKFYFPKGFGRIWESSIYDAKEILPYFEINRGVFIDVGANIGKYSLIMSKKIGNRGKVLAIEPEQKNFSVLKKNVGMNESNNILLENVALSDKDGSIEFYLAQDAGKHSIKRKTGKKVEVRGRKLDNLIKEHNLKEINLMKIDVEGAEVEVIRGARETIKKHKPRMVIEISSRENLEEIKSILSGYDFKKISKIDYYFYKK